MKNINNPTTYFKRISMLPSRTRGVQTPVFENKKMNNLTIGLLSESIGGDNAAITSISCTATQMDLKSGDKFTIMGQSFTMGADAAAGATSLTVSSMTPTIRILVNSRIEFDNDNLFVQYQRKTEGTIAGMPVDSDTLGPIDYKAGTYYITGVDPTYVKVLPSDFMINEDGSDEPLYFKDATNTGIQVNNADQEMLAFVNIPYGTSATEVKVWGSVTTKVVEVYECGVNANGKGSSIGSGTTNGSAISITTTGSTQYNYLLILIKVTATSNRVYGAQVTLIQS